MSFLQTPLRYLFNKSIESLFNTSASTPASYTAGARTVIDADTQSDDAAFYSHHNQRPHPSSLGARFKPQYSAALRPPRNDAEAQKLYNHVRTVAWYLDAIPLLGKGLPFNLGIDSILGFIPYLGDYLGLLLGIYQIYLCSLFGLPIQILAWMVLNVIIDCFLGLIPIVGDLLDVAFKANLRNLKCFEDHLRDTRGKCGAGQFYLEFPSNEGFIPVQDHGQRRGWFSSLFSSSGPEGGGERQKGSTPTRSTRAGAHPSAPTADASAASPDFFTSTPSGGHAAPHVAVPLALPRALATQVDDALAEAHAQQGSGVEGECQSEAAPETGEQEEAEAGDEEEGYSIPDSPPSTSRQTDSLPAAGSGSGSSSSSNHRHLQLRPFESFEVEEPHAERQPTRSPSASAIALASPGAVPVSAEWFVGSPEDRQGSSGGGGSPFRERQSQGGHRHHRGGTDPYDSSMSDAALHSEEDHRIGTSPESVAVHRRGYDPFLDLGVGSARSSMAKSRHSESYAGSRPTYARGGAEGGGSSDSIGNPYLSISGGDGKTGGEASMQRSLSQQGRRNVSWHESLSHPRNGSKQHHQHGDEEEGTDTAAAAATASRQSGLVGMLSRRDRRAAETRAQWRRRRTMYFVVYSAIFCVAYITSLDANTGYLYLNFACSEYGALASFSTVAIVQQMIFAVAKPPIAKLSDVFGRAEAYVLSLVLYVSGYATVASTASLRSLIGGICLQSAGNTGVQVLQSIIIADTTTAKWRGLVIGIVNLPYLINFAVAGPLVDAVMRNGSWRMGYAIWTVLVPLAATPLLVTLAVGQRRARRAGLATRNPLTGKRWLEAARELTRELDAIGLLLFTGGWLLILLPLTLAGHGERSDGIPSILFFVIGSVLLASFCWWETKAPAPILPYQFLANRAVICVCVVGILDFASFYISWTFLSAFIQILKGWDQTKTGYFATTQNVTSTVTGIVVGSLMAMTRRFKTLLVGGLVIRLVGVGMMIRYRNADDSTFMLVLCQLLQGIGGGSIAITMQVAVQVTVRHSDVAIVTALELLTTEIGAAIGSATAGWMFKSYLPTALAEHLPGMEGEELKLVYGSLQAALKYPLGSEEREGIILAWVQVMRYFCIVATVALIPALFFGMAIPDTHLPDVHGSTIAQSGHHGAREGQAGKRRSRSRNREERCNTEGSRRTRRNKRRRCKWEIRFARLVGRRGGDRVDESDVANEQGATAAAEAAEERVEVEVGRGRTPHRLVKAEQPGHGPSISRHHEQFHNNAIHDERRGRRRGR